MNPAKSVRFWTVLALVGTLAGCADDPPAAPGLGYEARQISLDADIQSQRELAEFQAQRVAIEADIVRDLHGEPDAMDYQHCMTIDPTTKAHQARCAKLIARTQRELAAMPKW